MIEKAVFKLSAVDQWIGHPLGSSDWVFIDQTQVNIFGEISRWRTPGHCDPEYAKTTPYGGTLIHGFHVVSLLSHFFQASGCWPEDGHNPLNYGLDKVRILKPMVIGDGIRLRSHMTLLEAVPKARSEYLLKVAHDIEVEGIEGSAVYAEYLTYWHPKKTAN